MRNFILSLSAVLLLTVPTYAQPARTIDLLTHTDGVHRTYGSEGLGTFGVPVSGGHDLDGDGFRDWAVAYMRASPFNRFEAGEVDLIFGDGSISGFVDTGVTPEPRILRIAGDVLRETAGSEIWIDDVTGDGLGDLLVARQNFTLATEGGSRIGAGALTIIPGSPNLRTQANLGAWVDLRSPAAIFNLTTLVGAAELDRLGIWMRAGDVTGDGINDLIVGADQTDQGIDENAGELWLIRGGPHLVGGGTIDLDDFGTGVFNSTALAGHVARITPPSGSEDFHLGATCTIADLDDNGRAEMLVAATISRAGAVLLANGAPAGSAVGDAGAPFGRVFIVWDDNVPSGTWSSGFTIPLQSPPGTLTTITGSIDNEHFGEELLAGEDFDGDDKADLFVGDLTADGAGGRPASGIGHVLYDAASLAGLTFNLNSLPNGVRETRMYGPRAEAIFGDTAAQGDFNLDGFTDLMASSPHDDPLGRIHAGTLHIFYGQDGGWPDLIDLAPALFPTPEEIRIVEVYGAEGTGGNIGDTLGYSAASGDIDGDGRIDVITNEMVGNGLQPGAIDVGNLIILSARTLSPVEEIFSDGFESGDFSSWSSVVSSAGPSLIGVQIW